MPTGTPGRRSGDRRSGRRSPEPSLPAPGSSPRPSGRSGRDDRRDGRSGRFSARCGRAGRSRNRTSSGCETVGPGGMPPERAEGPARSRVEWPVGRHGRRPAGRDRDRAGSGKEFPEMRRLARTSLGCSASPLIAPITAGPRTPRRPPRPAIRPPPRSRPRPATAPSAATAARRPLPAAAAAAAATSTRAGTPLAPMPRRSSTHADADAAGQDRRLRALEERRLPACEAAAGRCRARS